VRKSFANAIQEAEIKGLRFHDLRHTFASRLVGKGVDIVRVKELLGHSSVRITERYTHSSQEEKRKAVELLCRRSHKEAGKQGELLHIRYTGKRKKESLVSSSLFSVN
jgi:integrase